MDPTVSVVLAVHNDAAHIGESLASILSQDNVSFEVLVVDDGSTDQTPEILEATARIDRRVRVLTRPKGGLGASLNAGCSAARGAYIARMDSDDVSLPGRLARQAAFLDATPTIAVCGSFMSTFGVPPHRVVRLPVHDAAIRGELVFSNPILHPTVMMRREVVETLNGYDPTIRYGEDHDLWVRAIDRFAFANLPEVLLRYRKHKRQMGVLHAREEQQASMSRTQAKALAYLGIIPNPMEAALHLAISQSPNFGATFSPEPDILTRIEAWLERLLIANSNSSLSNEAFEAVVGRYWYFSCCVQMIHGTTIRTRYRHSPLTAAAPADLTSRWLLAVGGLERTGRMAQFLARARDVLGWTRFGI